MKKLLFILAFLIPALLINGQVFEKGQTPEEFRNAGNSKFDTLTAQVDTLSTRIDSLPGKTYNIVKLYDADNTGNVDVAEKIQMAINEAYDDGGGVVELDGLFKITDTVFLKSNVHIDLRKARTWHSSYTGPIWYSGPDEELIDASIIGGQANGTYNYTLVKLEKTASFSYEAKRVLFKNMVATNAACMFDFEASTGGWINANTIDNCQSWNCKRFLKTREGVGSSGIDLNFISNSLIQSGDSAYFGIDSLSGSNWIVSSLIFADWNVGPDSRQPIVLSATSSENHISTSGLRDYFDRVSDLGFDNVLYSDGQYFTNISDSLKIYGSNADASIINKLTVGHYGASGSAGSPAGDIAIKLNPKQTSEYETHDVSSSRILARNESSSNGFGFLYLGVWGGNTEGWIDAVEIDGSEEGDVNFINDVTINGDLTVNGNSPSSFALTDSLGWKNVLGYGANNTGVSSASSAFRAATLAASDDSSTVYVPAGLYYIPDSIIIYSGMSVLMDKNARLYTDGNNSIFYSGGRLRDFHMAGGALEGSGTLNGTGIKLVSAATANDMVRISFQDMRFYNMEVGIDMAASGTGYITTGTIHNMDFWACEAGIKMRGGTGSYSVNGMHFSALDFNSGPGCLWGIDGIYGNRHVFTDVKFFDYYTGSGGFAGSSTCYFHESSTGNYMNGSGIVPLVIANVDDIGYDDDGRGNLVISDGTIMPYNLHMDNNTSEIVASLSMPDNSTAGGVISYTLEVFNADSTQAQSETGIIRFSGVNLAGTETYSIDADDADKIYVESDGALTLTSAWAINAFNGYMHIRATFNSSITSPTLRLRYHIEQRSGYNLIHWSE